TIHVDQLSDHAVIRGIGEYWLRTDHVIPRGCRSRDCLPVQWSEVERSTEVKSASARLHQDHVTVLVGRCRSTVGWIVDAIWESTRVDVGEHERCGTLGGSRRRAVP